MSTPNGTTVSADHLYDGTERAALLHGLAARLNGYADRLSDDPCHVAGLRVMREVLDIVADRETVPAARLDTLTPDDVADLYAVHIGRAVDRTEDALRARGS